MKLVGDSGGVVAQRAQALALGLQRLVALQPELRQAQLRLELALVGAQRIAGGDALAKPVPALEGAGDRDLHRIGDDREDPADLAEVIVALVDDDQRQRQQGIQNAAEQQSRRSTGSVGVTKGDHGQEVP